MPESHAPAQQRPLGGSSVQSSMSSVPTSVLSATIEEEGSDVTEGSHVTGNGHLNGLYCSHTSDKTTARSEEIFGKKRRQFQFESGRCFPRSKTKQNSRF